MPFCHFSGYNFWLLKPTKLNRGQGIHVCNNISTIKSLIAKYCDGFPKETKAIAKVEQSPPKQSPVKNIVKAEFEVQVTNMDSPPKDDAENQEIEEKDFSPQVNMSEPCEAKEIEQKQKVLNRNN